MSYKKFTKDLGVLAFSQIVAAISGIITLPVITKLLGAENYGVWTQLMVTVGLLAPLILMGLPYGLVRFLPGEKDKKEVQDKIWSVFTLLFLVASVVVILLVIFSSVIAKFFECDKIFIIFLGFIILLECLNQLFSNVLRAFQEVKKCSFIAIFQSLVETGFIILSVVLGYGLLGAIVVILVVRILIFLIMGYLIVKKVGIKIPEFHEIKALLAFSLPSVLWDASSWITNSSDRYLIGFFWGTILVGYYSPAYTLGGAIAFFTFPMVFALPAVLSKHYDENKIDEVKKYLKYCLKYFLMISIPAVFGLTVLSKQLLNIFSTPEISQNSYFIVPFVALSMLLVGVCAIMEQTIVLRKKTKINGSIWMIAAAVNFGLNLILIPHFKLLGAGITTLLAYLLATGLTWRFSFKELLPETDWKFIAKSIFASLIMSVIVFALHPLGLQKTIITIAIGAILYFVVLLLLRAIGKNEIDFIKQIHKD